MVTTHRPSVSRLRNSLLLNSSLGQLAPGPMVLVSPVPVRLVSAAVGVTDIRQKVATPLYPDLRREKEK